MGFSQGLKERVGRRVRFSSGFGKWLRKAERGLRASQPCLKEWKRVRGWLVAFSQMVQEMFREATGKSLRLERG